MSNLLGAILGLGLAIAMTVPASAQGSPPPRISPDRQYTDDLVDRQTAIEGCIEDVQEIQATGEVPASFSQHGARLRDIKRQLKKERFSNWKDLMWGAAIRLCMQDKRFRSTCVSKRGREGELQFLETAKAPSCWDLIEERTEAAPPPSVIPRDALPIEIIPPVARMPAPVETPTAGPPLPPMSPADRAQFDEDVSIIAQPVRIIGDDEGGAKESRFSSCRSYWESNLSRNRPQDVRQVLMAVRVARCMYRTNFALLRTRSGCQWDMTGPWGWQQAVNILLSARCYARF